MISVTADISLNANEIHYSFIHATGPGGQNVNKVATAVQLRFDIVNSSSLSDEIKDRLIQLGGSRVTDEGEIVITARRFRSQERNRDDALKRLIKLIRKAGITLKPRYKTVPTKISIENRLQAKAHRKKIKQKRQAVDPYEE